MLGGPRVCAPFQLPPVCAKTVLSVGGKWDGIYNYTVCDGFVMIHVRDVALYGIAYRPSPFGGIRLGPTCLVVPLLNTCIANSSRLFNIVHPSEDCFFFAFNQYIAHLIKA